MTGWCTSLQTSAPRPHCERAATTSCTLTASCLLRLLGSSLVPPSLSPSLYPSPLPPSLSPSPHPFLPPFSPLSPFPSPDTFLPPSLLALLLPLCCLLLRNAGHVQHQLCCMVANGAFLQVAAASSLKRCVSYCQKRFPHLVYILFSHFLLAL